MSEEFGPDFITITDEEGNEFELELLDTFEFRGAQYAACVPAQMDEDDEDYGLILLKTVEENGETYFSTPDTEEEMNAVYEYYMEELFDEGEEDQ